MSNNCETCPLNSLLNEAVAPTEIDAQALGILRDGVSEFMGECEGYSRTWYLLAKLTQITMRRFAAVQDPEFTMCQSPFKQTEECRNALETIGRET